MTYPRGSVGTYTNWTCPPDSELRGGGGDYWTAYFTDTDGYDELYFAFNVMWRPGFDFVNGGKLPFLAGGPVNTQDATKPTEEMGFDCILMFRTSAEDSRTTGRIQYYVYHQNCPDPRYAESREWVNPSGDPFIFDVSDSTWYNIAVRIKVNSWANGVGNRDGFIEGFIDGQFIMGMYNLEFLSGINEGMGLDRMGIASFFGGCSINHAAKRDEWAWLDDFVVWYYGEGEDVPRGFDHWSQDQIMELPNLKTKTPPPVEEDTMHITTPINLHTTLVGGSFISLAWDYPPDSLAPKGYKIYWLDKEGIALGKNYTIGNLRPNTTYTIAVSSYDDFEESDPTAELVITTTAPDTIPPAMPTNLHSTFINERTITVAWDESTDNVAVDGYLVYVNGLKVAQSFITEYSVLGLQASTSYNIAISAVDAENNESPQTAAISISTTAPDLTPPSVPQGLEATLVTQNSIGIEWEESTDNVQVDGYYIYINGIQRALSLMNSFTISGLSAGIEYIITVSAYDHMDNESDKSDAVFARTRNPDGQVVVKFPEVEILRVETEEEEEDITRSVSTISSFGHVETIEYGVTITELTDEGNVNVSRDDDLETGRNTLYLVQKTTQVVHGDRVQYGLQALYYFDEGVGGVILDKSTSDDPIDLEIADLSQVAWLPGQGLKVEGSTIISSTEVPTRLIDALKSTNEITLEAWIRTSKVNQSGPARILSISKDNFNRAATLGQVGDPTSYNYSVRMNTSEADDNGLPEIFTTEDFISMQLHHVVYTRDYLGEEHIYLDGAPVYSGSRGGDFSSLGDDYLVSIANELSGERPWEGTFYLLAIYNKALFSHEVIQNFSAGLGEIRYTTELPVEHNISYEIRPFVLTDQGIVYGDVQGVLNENILYNTGEDSVYLALYPNPSDGDFYVHVECALADAGDAFLRIVDMMGKVVYHEVLEELPAICEENSLIDPNAEGPPSLDTGINDKLIPLSGLLKEGIYSVMLVVGHKVVASRLVVQH